MIYFYTQSLKVALAVAASNDLKMIRNWVLRHTTDAHAHIGQFRSGVGRKIKFIDWELRNAFCIHLLLSSDATWPIFITNKHVNGLMENRCPSHIYERTLTRWLVHSAPAECVWRRKMKSECRQNRQRSHISFENGWRRFSQSDTTSSSFPFCIRSGLRSRLLRVFDLKIKRK